MLITGSWDPSLKFWDPRASVGTSNANTDIAASTHALPERVYHLDLVNNTRCRHGESPISYTRYSENGGACADEGAEL